ncbi:MAG: hypothetical protein IPK83_16070 [Planctomycetes bacterium]|nr:hypothetical protein [Planctomycetota bacterium]
MGKPRVEVFIPSISELGKKAAISKTATLYESLSVLIPAPQNETGEGLDFDAIAGLAEKIASWPDTPITIAIFTQDREGRARWMLEVNWSMEEFASRLRQILEDESAKQLLKNVELKEDSENGYRLELPDMLLAVVRKTAHGAMIASSTDVSMPEEIWKGAERKRKISPVLYCRLNLDAGTEEEKGSSLFSGIAGVDAVRYELTPRSNGEWSDTISVSWNPLLGAALKLLFKKVSHPFDCPKNAFATAVINSSMGEGAADALTGLPLGTIGSKVGSEMMFASVEGTGFLPVPDQFFVFHTEQSPDTINEAIRGAISEETKRRAEDDLAPRWYEIEIDGKVVFWRDPGADGVYGLMPMTFRTVIFFDHEAEDDDHDARLVVCSTSTWADDAVKSWAAANEKTIKLPVSKKVHWQAKLNWKTVYALAHPFLGILSSFVEGSSMPPDAAELGDALADSDIQIQIGFGGLNARHIGPMPLGAIYVPAVMGMALSTGADGSSEAAREQTACRNLRVLYHHSKLFKRDYGRWPANVAELDGYVDFASHWSLLYLRKRERSFGEGLVKALFASDKKKSAADSEVDEKAYDDSLYVIEWSKSDNEWQLMYRADEFVHYENIYIDSAGEIHRIPRKPISPVVANTGAKSDPPKNSDEVKPGKSDGEKQKGDSDKEKKQKTKKKILL